MAFPLTEEQRKIVEDRGGELLVSAAAGSGKTCHRYRNIGFQQLANAG